MALLEAENQLLPAMMAGGIRRANSLRIGKQGLVLLLGAVVLAGTASLRSFEYDEAYSVFVTSPVPRPSWPASVFTPAETRSAFTDHAGPVAIARALRATDVHPPLYFWTLAAWRSLFGDGLLTLRLLSVACALAALAAVGAIARRVGIPPALAMLFTLGSYGFAYTGAIARGFAPAQALTLWGVWLLLRAAGASPTSSLPFPAPRSRDGAALAGGLLLGAATLTNYLAAFGAAAALGWLLLVRRRRPALWLTAGLGFAAFLPADLWFFLAQRDSRLGQFPPFRIGAGLVRLAEYATANLFGGLPLYAGERALLVAAGQGGTMLALAALVAWRWRTLAREARWLLLGGALASPFGLLLLGAIFGNSPIELRYLCFAMPFAGLLLAGGLAAGPGARAMRTAVIALQALAIAGLMTRAETMQPARAAARAAAALAGTDAVILLPRGNDGVGVVGPFLAELPDATRVLLVDQSDTARLLCARLPRAPVVLALLAPDAASRAEVAVMRAAFPHGSWCAGGAEPGYSAGALRGPNRRSAGIESTSRMDTPARRLGAIVPR